MKKILKGWISPETILKFRSAPLGMNKMIAIFLFKTREFSKFKKVKITIEEQI